MFDHLILFCGSVVFTLWSECGRGNSAGPGWAAAKLSGRLISCGSRPRFLLCRDPMLLSAVRVPHYLLCLAALFLLHLFCSSLFPVMLPRPSPALLLGTAVLATVLGVLLYTRHRSYIMFKKFRHLSQCTVHWLRCRNFMNILHLSNLFNCTIHTVLNI